MYPTHDSWAKKYARRAILNQAYVMTYLKLSRWADYKRDPS